MSNETQDKDQVEVIAIQEEKDGSATIELPASIPSPEAEANAESEDHDVGSDEDDEAARQREMAMGGEVDPEAERLREQKRQKRRARKEYHKQVNAEKDVKLTLLERQNQELLERLSVLEKKSHGSDIARLNGLKPAVNSRRLRQSRKRLSHRKNSARFRRPIRNFSDSPVHG